MRRLTHPLRWLLLTTIVGVVLTVCSLVSLSGHTSSSLTTKQDCTVSCNTHAQAGTSVQSNYSEEDDDEPVPPALSGLTDAASLLLLYSVPTTVLWLVFGKSKKHHLSTQLRY
jgi:hypothetical protein